MFRPRPWRWAANDRRPEAAAIAWHGSQPVRPSSARHLANMEDEEIAVALLAFEEIARLAQQVGNIEAGERVAADDDELLARRPAAQCLARPQRRQRAFQTLEIETVD